MDLGALHSAGKVAQEVDDELDQDIDDGAPEVAPAPSASIGGLGLDDDEEDDFADAPRGPQDDEPSAAPAGEANLESLMRQAGGAISEPEVAPDAPAGQDPKATSEGGNKPDHEKTEEEKAEEERLAALEGQGGIHYTGSPIDLLERLNLGARHNKLVHLYKTMTDPEAADRLATAYVNELVNTGVIDEINRADADKAQAEKMIQSAEQESAYQTGGGSLVSMLGSLLRFGRGPKGPTLDIQEAGKRRRLAEDQASGIAAERTAHIGEVKYRRYKRQIEEIGIAAEQLRRSILLYNEAIMDAPGNEALKAAVEARAAENDWSVHYALADIAGGNADDDLKAHLAKAAENSLFHEEVRAASEAMHRMQDNLFESFDGAIRHADSAMDSGLLDPEKVKENLMASFEEIEKDLPDPIAEAEEKRQLSERMRELREALMASVEALVQRFTEAFSNTFSR